MADLIITDPLAGLAIDLAAFGARPLTGTVVAVEGAPPADAGLPTMPCTAAQLDGWRALWVRPDGWLLVDTEGRNALEPRWAGLQEADVCRVTDLSHATALIALTGSAATGVLGRGTPLDLRPSRFFAGRCARTWCAGFQITLDHRGDSILLLVDTPLARSFWDWLADASSGFAAEG